MNIEQLVKKGKTKEKYAIDEILKRYTPLILKTINGIYINGYEREDLIQIGYLSIITAIGTYDLDKNSNFTAYLVKVVRNNYYYLIRKRSKENYEISYDKLLSEGICLDVVSCRENSEMEDSLIKREKYSKLNRVLTELSTEEREFLFFIFRRGYGGLKEYSENKNINYETLVKRKKRLIEKLRKNILINEMDF